MMNDKKERLEALLEYLEVDELPDTVETGTCYFGAGLLVMFNDDKNTEYYVLTDEEANTAAQAYIEDSLWAFNSNFLTAFLGLPYDFGKVLQAYQEKKCEDANELLKTLIERMSENDDPMAGFAQEAIAQDGRGHFIGNYDSEEIEAGDYFIYRMN